MIFIILTVFSVPAAVLVIAAGLLRCPKCGDWHEQPQDCDPRPPP